MLIKKPPFKITGNEDTEGKITIAKVLSNAIVMEAIQKNGKIKFKIGSYGKFI